MVHLKNVSFCLIVVALVSCKATEPQPEVITNPPSTARGYLVSYAKTGALTVSDIIAAGAEEGDISSYLEFGLDLYSIVYNSILDGESLEVSGLIFVPKEVDGDLDILQNHHGTTIPGDNEIPSAYRGGTEGIEMSFVGAAMAANGYVVAMPDYVGYGASADREHPYTVHDELAEESVDMLLATRQLMDQLSLSFSGNVFLTGWSEGGGAGLAAHRLIQAGYSETFKVKGTSLLAGPYDYYSFLQDVLVSRRDVSDINLTIYSWSIYALNKSKLNRAASSIWNHSVNNQMDALDLPSYKLSETFRDTFISGLVNETDQDWVDVTMQNNLISGWKPEGYVYLHSGTEDYIVPHYNSVNAHQYFQSIGVNSKLYEYDGGDHYTPLFEYVTTTLDDFENL